MMKNVSLDNVAASKFIWSNSVGTAEASSLFPELRLKHIYDDAEDVGFTVTSDKTQTQIVFVMSDIDEECMNFVSVFPEKYENKFKLTIFND